jgi:hypothetical protein
MLIVFLLDFLQHSHTESALFARLLLGAFHFFAK